jgi:aspartate racemase
MVKIGILGGIGPEATAEFYGKLIRNLQRSGRVRSNVDFPNIMINSINAPELIKEEVSDEDLQHYITGLKQLDAMDVNFIVMACNTIHLFHRQLQSHISARILDLREEVRKYSLNHGFRKILVLGTISTIEKGLYEFKGIETMRPSKEELNVLAAAIYSMNSTGIVEKEAVEKICERYENLGAQVTILGCTELGVMLGGRKNRIDTMDILADAVMEELFSS